MPADRGATLLELLIYVALVATILTAATLFAQEFVMTQAKQAAYSEVSRNGRLALARIGVEVREAAAINVGSSAFGANPSVVSLASPSPAIDPTVFTASSGTLLIQQGAGAATPLTSSKVEVAEFVVDDVSTPGRTQALRFRLKIRTKDPTAWQQVFAEAVYETTVRVNIKDGFSN